MGQGRICNVLFEELQKGDCMVQGRYLEVERDEKVFRDWKMPPV
jgi:hypothetical protein